MKYIKLYITEKLRIDKDIVSPEKKQYPSKLTQKNFREFLNIEGLNVNVRSWYRKKYPNDDIWRDIPQRLKFKQVLSYLGLGNGLFDKADCDAGDSVVRERMFEYMRQVCNVSYDDIYNLWIES